MPVTYSRRAHFLLVLSRRCKSAGGSCSFLLDDQVDRTAVLGDVCSCGGEMRLGFRGEQGGHGAIHLEKQAGGNP